VRFVGQPTDTTARAQTRKAIKRMMLTRGMQVGDKMPTYRELAEQFGVALLTIQRVMRDLAEEGLIYRLHSKGAFIKRVLESDGQLSQVGLLYPASMSHLIEAAYLNQFLSGLVTRCDRSRIDLQVLSIRRTMQKIPAREVAARVDGVVLLGVLNEDYVAEFLAEGIPLVLADGQASRAPVHSLAVDNAGGIRQVMEYLRSLGHRRIAYVEAHSPDFVANPGVGLLMESCDNRERREAYLAAMGRLDLGRYQRVCRAFDEQGRFAPAMAARDLLGQSEQPTAVLTDDTYQAAALHRCLGELGIRIPRDLSMAAGIGARGDPLVGNQALTFARGDFRGMGWRAIEILQMQAAGRQSALRGVERIATTLVIGTTTARPRPHARIE
jgi:DNA-binding LacI/PurR family transcriptional regulator